jgi:GT2 family glycosyltransferase
MEVSIIIVNYNTRDLTYQCVESIWEMTKGIQYEIILVDNASKDGSVEFFSELENIVLITSDKNLGFGNANNLGFKSASGKYILFLNSDTILLNNAVKEFYDEMERSPWNVGCLGAKLLAEDGVSENNSYGYFPSLKRVFKSIFTIYLPFSKKKRKSIIQDSFEVDYIIGADLFIRRYVIDKLGLFDPEFFMYFEETELQLRYKNAGYLSKIVSTPKIIHLENASDLGVKNYSSKSRKMYFESMFIYMRKRYSKPLYILFRLLILGYLPVFILSSNSLKDRAHMCKIFFK